MENEQIDGIYYLKNNKNFHNREINGSLEDGNCTKVDTSRDGGGGGMGSGDYVTHRELNMTKESIERKIDSTEANLKVELSNIDHKIDKSITEFKDEISKQKSANIKWTIGTALALASVMIGALKLFIG